MGSGMDEYWKAKREEERMAEHLHRFNVTHRDADELIVDEQTGEILGAVYYSIAGKNKNDLLRFFKLLKSYLSL